MQVRRVYVYNYNEVNRCCAGLIKRTRKTKKLPDVAFGNPRESLTHDSDSNFTVNKCISMNIW